MLNDFFVTKIGMTQAWTKEGKRLAITRCALNPNIVVDSKSEEVLDSNAQKRQTKQTTILEIGHGRKKLKNMSKPLRSRLEKGGFSFGVAHIDGIRVADAAETVPQTGDTITVDQVLSVGDVVKVQGVSKGRGFAGAVKRHGFAGGPRTHGQSDRERAVGSIGAGTTPGRVWPGKKMPGNYGTDCKSVQGLVIVHIDSDAGELWLSGPVPGHFKSEVKITRTGKNKPVHLDPTASGITIAGPKTEDNTETTIQDAQAA